LNNHFENFVGKNVGTILDGDTWQDVCERVPIVQPPSLSSVLWSNEDEEYTTTEVLLLKEL